MHGMYGTSDGWIRTKYFPSNRVVVFVLYEGDVLCGGLREKFVELCDPDKLGNYAATLVTEANPELVGCTVRAIIYDIGTASWRFSVYHGSFEPVAIGDVVPERRLKLPEPLTVEGTARTGREFI